MASDKRHISRRKYLQTSTLGLAGLAAVPEGSAKDTVKLPFLRQGDSIVSCYEAPRSWHKHNEHAKRMLRNNRGQNNNNIVGSGLGRSDKKFGGWRGRRIHYDVKDISKFAGPDEIDGISVTFSETGFEEICGCYNDQKYNQIPGGASWGLDGTGLRDGTACARVKYDNDDWILTANHVMSFNDNCNDTTGNTGKQCGQVVGDVGHYNGEEDWALVQDSQVDAASPGAIDNTSYWHDLKGHVTQSGLDYLDCNGEDIHKVGASSGVTASDIKNTNYNYTEGCYDLQNNGLRTHIDSTYGDSGSPIYWVDGNDDAWLCGLASFADTDNDAGYDDCGNDMYEQTWGISAEHLYFKHDIKFGEGSETTTSYNSCP